MKAAVRLPIAVLVLAAAAGWAGGCTLGPAPDRPASPVDLDAPYLNPHASDSAGLEWSPFGPPADDRFVHAALDANPDLAVAAARFREAVAVRSQARAAFFPSVDATFARDRRRQSFELPITPGDPQTAGGEQRLNFLTTTYDLSATLAYPVDLFGRDRRTAEAAAADLRAAAADRRAAELSLIAEAVRLRVAVAAARQRQTIARADADALRQTLDVVASRFDNALATAVDLVLARENLAAADARLPDAAVAVRLAEHAAAVLVGRRPGDPFALTLLPDDLPAAADLPPPPADLPAALLDARPDLAAADLRARAAAARVGVAVADLFPGLTLTASAGFASSDLSSLISGDTLVYNLLTGVTQPLFDAGRRRAFVRAARARHDVAVAQYAALVLSAMRDVEDSLARDAAARESATLRRRALDEARVAEALAAERFALGLEPLLVLLETQRRRRTAEDALVQATQNAWDARADLYLALGGGGGGGGSDEHGVTGAGRRDDDEARLEGNDTLPEDARRASHLLTRVPRRDARPDNPDSVRRFSR